jgi:mannose-6-phosphate isomerase-like protein (cupin superfamily)
VGFQPNDPGDHHSDGPGVQIPAAAPTFILALLGLPRTRANVSKPISKEIGLVSENGNMVPTKKAVAFVVRPGEGQIVEGPVGGPVTIKARAENTAGSFTLVENIVGPMEGPPLHVHGREDEMWYILEGHFRFRADENIFDAPAGSFVFVPRGTHHCFQNIGKTQGRVLVMFTPAGMEKFFELHAELRKPVDPAAYRSIARECSMEVVGQTLDESNPT